VMDTPENAPRRLDALQDVAEGAINLGLLREANIVANVALAAARARGEHRTAFRMEIVLERAARLSRALEISSEMAPTEMVLSEAAPSSLLRTLERVLAPAGAGT
ncbi:MAG: hypothetical protein M3P24_12370, partial [Gemmatimonadota bacterium]|nr:hypothetical protein [Gemmatimonadota bacterium]